MNTKVLFVVSIFFTALALGGGLAHLYELPGKIRLSSDDYLTVQQIYRGWALLGIAILVALLSTIALAIRLRAAAAGFPLAVIAAVCIALSLVVFFLFTFPTNQATRNWTQLPENWETLRRRWEYSHAVGAMLYLIALVSLAVAAVSWREL